MTLPIRLALAMVTLVAGTTVAILLLVNHALESIVGTRALRQIETEARLVATELSDQITDLKSDVTTLVPSIALDQLVRNQAASRDRSDPGLAEAANGVAKRRDNVPSRCIARAGDHRRSTNIPPVRATRARFKAALNRRSDCPKRSNRAHSTSSRNLSPLRRSSTACMRRSASAFAEGRGMTQDSTVFRDTSS